ncbi:ROK family protein [Streptomyces sp. NPDC056304]|uniref:ROK family protein n=1 Tax=Streptomyces sp. NPDC056304 TaxID=3345778 RepID=UPI0035E1D074
MSSATSSGGTGAPVIGLDLGGTKIAAALFGADGAVLARHTRPTPALEGATAVLDALAGAAATVDPGRLATALGIAAAGVVDPRTGVVTSATDSIRGWAGTALGAGLADRTGLPVACDNDVRATAGPELAALRARRTGHGPSSGAAGPDRPDHLEPGADGPDRVEPAAPGADGPDHVEPAAPGAGRGSPGADGPDRVTSGPDGPGRGSLLFAAVGTGVGGAIAVDGRMLHGAAGIAGHLGHLPSPEAAGLPCTCGATGHLEVIASGPGIVAHYERLAGCPVDRLETVAARAARGDAAAVRAITVGAAATGHVLGGLANALGPDRVVVGGGVPRIGPLYGDALTAAFAAELMPPLRRLRPEAPLFGADAAVLGAAALTTTLPLHHPGAAR